MVHGTVRSTRVVDEEILLPQLRKHQQLLQPHTFTQNILPPQTGEKTDEKKRKVTQQNITLLCFF